MTLRRNFWTPWTLLPPLRARFSYCVPCSWRVGFPRGWHVETAMSLADRDGVLDTATRFMARHGNDVALFEAYLLLVIPAYKAGIFGGWE